MPNSKKSCSSPTCNELDNEFMVSCDKCFRWWHYSCHGFNPDLYDTNTPWFCGEIDCIAKKSETENPKQQEDEKLPFPSDSLKQLDLFMEAAVVAQAAVSERDKQIEAMRAELEEMKLKLSASIPPPVSPANIQKNNDRLEILKRIQENHQSLLKDIPKQSIFNVPQSTPLFKPSNPGTENVHFPSTTIQGQEMATLLTILNRNNVQELPIFSGENRREWPYFEEVFKSTTIEGKFSDKENVSRLRKALKGEAYQLVCDRLKYSSDADAIMTSLRVIYGRCDVLVHDLTTDLLNLPKLASKSDPKIRLWAVKVNGYVADVRSMNKEEDLTNGYVMTNLSSKLGAGLYQEWQKKKANFSNANFVQFAEFLNEKVIDLPPDLMKPFTIANIEAKKNPSSTRSSKQVLTHQAQHSDSLAQTQCKKCSMKQHPLHECVGFKNLSESEKNAFVKENLICFTCLDPSKHNWRSCAKKRTCGLSGCTGRHHPLLHQSKEVNSVLNTSASAFVPQPHIHSSHIRSNTSILFKIAPIRLHGKNNRFVDTFAFLDDGSSLTMLEKDLFDELHLDGASEDLTLQWTKGVTRKENSLRTSFEVSAITNPKRHILNNVFTVKDLDLPSQSIDVSYLKNKYSHLRGLPLVDLVDAKPKILIGLDQAKFLLGQNQRHGKDQEPCAQKTRLGWIVFGSGHVSHPHVSCIHTVPQPKMKLLFHDAIKPEESLHDLVKQHFSTEEFGVKPPKGDFVSREEKRAMEIMDSSLKLLDGQYEIGLLWTSDDVKLPDSYSMAFKRLVGFEKSLKKKPHLLEWQNHHMRTLLEKGYARIASEQELSTPWPRVWYTPTFIVENPNKLPIKPRSVCDVAAKVNGVSLNTFLLKGPDNLVPLHAGLFKFRERSIAVNADVKEMFHQIKIKREDQQCQRILWRDGDISKKPSVYIMQVMMFGPRCSPTCAQFVKNHHANLFKKECPEAVDGLTKRTYVDDYFNSHNTVKEAVSVTRDAIRICKSMHFDLVSVQSNNLDFLSQMPKTHIKTKIVSIDPNECEGYIAKVLGMFWQPSSDCFLYKLAEDNDLKEMLLSSNSITKRSILRAIMRVFDPLGLISIYIIRGRIILQEIWREGFGWDELVSSELQNKWLTFIKELKNIESLRIPRRYTSFNPDDCKITLITFVDASEKAFVAVAYFRFQYNKQVEIAQVLAKAKVAPVKQLTIPRLELQAAVLGVRLVSTIKQSHTIKIDEEVFLSDSKTVLSWIHSTTFKFPTFVACRVGEILDTTSPKQWYHVSSNDNVADDGTKWFDDSMGNHLTRWFLGPDFLRQEFSEWPIKRYKSEPELDSPGIVSVHLTPDLPSFDVYNRLSARFKAKWSSSVRVIGFLLRFKDLIKKIPFEKQAYITPTEYIRAENWLFQKIRCEAFPKDLLSLRKNGTVCSKSSILSLSPFLDEEGTIRISSRAQKANCSYASKNPAILPNNHPLVNVFIQHHHDLNFHIGSASIISDIRERAWIIFIRKAVERVRSKCFECKRLKAKPVMPLMGQLPEARLAFNSRPFTHVGVDCFGPLLVKFGRGTVKRYGMIFTCLTYRAVQIELLNDLSLDQCIMAVRRFVINRVVTRFLYSDNGLNFIGAKNMMDKDVREMQSKLSEYSANYENILWRFIPAYSPWMGGSWERLIQSVKKSVNLILKTTVPREDVLRNALMEAQFQINRRPLTHIPVDPEDPKPLTPNMMLFGEEDKDVTTPGVFTENDACSRLYCRRAQHLTFSLVKRWYKEYLPDIIRRNKWYKNTKEVEVDDIVIVVDPDEFRSLWKLGRVIKVYPGPDNIVRVADVKLSNGSIKLKRSVGRLAVLDLKSST